MNKFIDILLIAFLLILVCPACNHYKNHEIPTKTSFDSSQIIQLFNKAKILLDDSLDKAPAIIDEMLYESRLVNWEKGIALSLSCRGKYYALKKNYPLAVNEIMHCLNAFLLTPQLCVEQAEAKYNLASIYYWMGNDDSGFFYRQEAAKEYDLFNDSIDLAKTFVATGNDFINTGSLTEEKLHNALKYWTKAYVIKEHINDTSQRELPSNIGLGYLMLQNNDSAEKYLQIAYKKSCLFEDTGRCAVTLVQLSRIDEAKALYSDAISKLTEAKKLYVSLGSKGLGGVATTLNNIASIYNTIGDYAQAITLYQQSLDISEKLDNAELIGSNLNDLTIVYVAIKNYDDALKMLIYARSYFLNSEDSILLSSVNGNIGAVYYQKKNYDSAINFSEKCLRQMHLPSDSIDPLITIAESHTDLGNYKEAYHNYLTGLNITAKTDDKLNQAKILIGMTHLTMAQLKETEVDKKMRYSSIDTISILKQAKQYIDSAISYSKIVGSIIDLVDEYKLLSDIQKQLGNYKEALVSLENHYLFRDSIRSSDKVKEIVKKDLQYKYEKQKALETLTHQNQLTSIKIRNKQRILIGSLISFSVVMLIVIVTLFQKERSKRKHQLELLSLKNEMLELQQESLKAQLDAHFITDTIAYINEFIELGNLNAASTYVNKFSRLIRTVLELSFERNDLTIKEELAFIENYIQLLLLQYSNKKIDYSIIVDKRIDIDHTKTPSMVLQVLVENAIVHGVSKNGGVVQIKFNKKNESVECIVEDNGVGRNVSQNNKNVDRKSYGITLSNKLLKNWSKGQSFAAVSIEDLKDDSGIPAGTSVRFSFPLIETTINHIS